MAVQYVADTQWVKEKEDKMCIFLEFLCDLAIWGYIWAGIVGILSRSGRSINETDFRTYTSPSGTKPLPVGFYI